MPACMRMFVWMCVCVCDGGNGDYQQVGKGRALFVCVMGGDCQQVGKEMGKVPLNRLLQWIGSTTLSPTSAHHMNMFIIQTYDTGTNKHPD